MHSIPTQCASFCNVMLPYWRSMVQYKALSQYSLFGSIPLSLKSCIPSFGIVDKRLFEVDDIKRNNIEKLKLCSQHWACWWPGTDTPWYILRPKWPSSITHWTSTRRVIIDKVFFCGSVYCWLMIDRLHCQHFYCSVNTTLCVWRRSCQVWNAICR